MTESLHSLEPSPTSDGELACALRESDSAAFAELYDRYAPRLFALALRMLKQTSDAEALVSDVFSEIWRKPTSFDPNRGQFHTYLLTLARSRAIDRIRSTTLRTDKSIAAARSKSAERRTESANLSPANIALVEERDQLVRAAVESLEPEHRQTLELAYFDGLTHVEIAEQTGLPLGTVKTRIRQAMQTLRYRLREFE